MSGQFFPSRFEEPSTRGVRAPVLVPASAPRKLVAALLDVLVVAVPLVWGVRELRADETLGWVGVGVGGALLVLQLVLPAAASRTVFMALLGLRLLDLDTGDPVRGGRTLLRHVWPPSRPEVCDVRPHVVADARGERPSDAIVPPVGPAALGVDQVSGTLISQVPGAPQGPALRPAVLRPSLPDPAPEVAVPQRVEPEPRASVPDEGTIVRPAQVDVPTSSPRRGWTLTFETGHRVEVTSRVLVGRDPEAGADPDAELLPFDDPHRSLSKTHALLRRRGDELLVEDLDSTNGVVVVRAGADHEVVPGTPFVLAPADELYLGQLRVDVTAGSAS